jgi:hypothetical protein
MAAACAAAQISANPSLSNAAAPHIVVATYISPECRRLPVDALEPLALHVLSTEHGGHCKGSLWGEICEEPGRQLGEGLERLEGLHIAHRRGWAQQGICNIEVIGVKCGEVLPVKCGR